MDKLTTWLWLGLATAAVMAALLALRGATVRKRRAAQQAARELAEQRLQQAARNQAQAHAQAQTQADAERRAAQALARQQAQPTLLAHREATAAEREARRRAADEAARQHAQALVDKRLVERAAARAQAAAQSVPPSVSAVPTPALRPTPTPARAAPRTRADTLVLTVVLVADDSKVVRVKLARLLEQHGFQVMLAEDGLAALRQMQLQTPHVLLTDAEMPGLNGLELTRQVRSRPHMAHVMVLMITSADASLGPAAAAAGVTAVLGKPYAEDQLLAHLDRVRDLTAATAMTASAA